MVRELKEMGVELMVSIWPTVNPLSENYTTMQERGLLVRTERGLPALMVFQDNCPEGPVYLHYYDATHPEARQFIWEQIREHYYQYGIKTWWLDACEPEMYPLDADNLRFHLGNGAALANAYLMLHERGFYENQRQAGEDAILNLCRSAWAGSQRYGAAVWSGDIDSTFEALRTQVRTWKPLPRIQKASGKWKRPLVERANALPKDEARLWVQVVGWLITDLRYL